MLKEINQTKPLVLGENAKEPKQVNFETDTSTGTVRYIVPEGKTAYLSVSNTSAQGTGTRYYYFISGTKFYSANGLVDQMVFQSGAVITDGNYPHWFSGYEI
jgi:hypothetical protein